ncbi:hypothetical protein ABPG75_007865 [Micractinium tetrahymenae]
MSSSPYQSWSVQQVAAWLTGELELPQKLADEFVANAIGGSDLATLTDDDLVQELKCTSLQARKIRKALTQLGVPAPAASAPPAAPAAAAPPAPAPAPAPAPVAVAPVPAAPAAGAEPDPRTAFNAADIARYRKLQDQIAGLRSLEVPTKLAQAKRHAGNVAGHLDSAQRTLPAARKALQEAQEEYTKYAEDKWYPGKVLGGKSKQQEKLEKSKMTLDQASRRVQELEGQVSSLQAQLGEAQKQLAAWQAKESELATAQRMVEEVVQRMFAGPAWSASPRQNEIRDVMRALEGQAVEAHRGVQTYGRGSQLLTSAAKRLAEAIQAMRGTQMLNMMGMGRGMMFTAATGVPGRFQPGQMMGDIAELAIFRRANESVAQAARETMEARQLLGPGVPQVDESILKAAKAGLFINMLTGGVMSDMMQAAMVRKSVADTEKLLEQVQPAAQWAQQNLAAYQAREGGLRSQIDGKRGELEAFRREMLRAGLEASAAPASGLAAQVEAISLI